jgi:hypothetical protein
MALPHRRSARRGTARPPTDWLPTVVPTLQALVNAGSVTPGLVVTPRAGHLTLGRQDAHGADPRFRLTPLGGTLYGLSLYRRRGWEPLPYQGTLEELVEVLNTDLHAWAADWA